MAKREIQSTWFGAAAAAAAAIACNYTFNLRPNLDGVWKKETKEFIISQFIMRMQRRWCSEDNYLSNVYCRVLYITQSIEYLHTFAWLACKGVDQEIQLVGLDCAGYFKGSVAV